MRLAPTSRAAKGELGRSEKNARDALKPRIVIWMFSISVLTLYERSQIDLTPRYNGRHLINTEGLNLSTAGEQKQIVGNTLLVLIES